MDATLMKKYRPYPTVGLKDRTWPDKTITQPPKWCSVDLRDGNQALITPMTLGQKVELFLLLVELGFKEIEVGFPAAAQVEYDFLRHLIENGLIPADVTVQVLTQAREHLIRRTFEALRGCPRAIVHVYNSTSTVQRKVVFRMDRDEIKKIAMEGVRLVKDLSSETDTQIILEYSPESFTGTEVDYAAEVCNGVMEVWQPTPDDPMILNLPATVEMSTPNIYADQIEWFIRNLEDRSRAIVSLHTHNDRGTAVAATELALMAGGDRVEGTLFGNGERTGNVDIITVALNMYSQGVDPGLNLHKMDHIMEVAQRVTQIPVHPRHPYAGELVYTAFSGSHQDAINKGMNLQRQESKEVWEVPYLPLDPRDLGRSYEAIIRINSQSGKGGVAYIMEADFGYQLPKAMHPEFARAVQRLAEQSGREIAPKIILETFEEMYLNTREPFELLGFRSQTGEDGQIECSLKLCYQGTEKELSGRGNGPIAAAKDALVKDGLANFQLKSYHEHSLGEGADSTAVAYISLVDERGNDAYGAGVDPNINIASVRAMISSLNILAKKS